MIVYAITNLINGKRYIGLTEFSLKRRWSQHTHYARRAKPTAIHRAIAKYGVENFAIVELASFAKGTDREVLCEMERFYIAQENTLTPNGYNMTPGGDGTPKGELNPNWGRKASDSKREKIRAAWTPERKAKAVLTIAAIRNRPDVKEKMRLAYLSDETKAKVAKSWTPERRALFAERAKINKHLLLAGRKVLQ